MEAMTMAGTAPAEGQQMQMQAMQMASAQPAAAQAQPQAAAAGQPQPGMTATGQVDYAAYIAAYTQAAQQNPEMAPQYMQQIAQLQQMAQMQQMQLMQMQMMQQQGGAAAMGAMGMAAAVAAPAAAKPQNTMMGQVKNFNDEKGYGFISCPGAKTDVFFMRGDVQGGASIQGGDKVSFNMTQGDRGPRGEDVTVLPPGTDIGMNSGGPMGGAPGQSAGVPSGPTYEGMVKRYDEERGFGFIDCDILRQSTGKDVMLLRSTLSGLVVKVGDRVSFTVEENGGKGVKASSVTLLPPLPEGMGGGSMGGGSFGGSSGGPPQQNNGPVYYGEIRRYDDDKGFGFIECPETKGVYDKDIFLLRSAMKNSPQPGGVGMRVSFNVTVGQKGPVAENVVVLGPAEPKWGGDGGGDGGWGKGGGGKGKGGGKWGGKGGDDGWGGDSWGGKGGGDGWGGKGGKGGKGGGWGGDSWGPY